MKLAAARWTCAPPGRGRIAHRSGGCAWFHQASHRLPSCAPLARSSRRLYTADVRRRILWPTEHSTSSPRRLLAKDVPPSKKFLHIPCDPAPGFFQEGGDSNIIRSERVRPRPYATMKTQTNNLLILTILVSMLSRHSIQAAEYYWRSSWGVFPDQVDTTMRLGSAPTNRSGPILIDGVLILRTLTRNINAGDGMADYQIYDQAAPNIVVPTQLVIEAEVQLESGVSTFSGRPPACIAWTTAPGVSGILGIEVGRIYLGRNQVDHWGSTNVPTDDAFHHYRIEVERPTVTNVGPDQVRVYRDFDPVPILRAPMGGDGANTLGTTVEIFWGDGTDWAYGVSKWRSFRHNAARTNSRPVMFIRTVPEEICWSSYTGVLYQVHYCSELNSANWLPLLTNVVGTADTTCVTDPDPRHELKRFYRVEVQQ